MQSNLEVSVIIPMRNEGPYIGACLDSVLRNNFPQANYEILVVDGHSSDDSVDVVRRKAAERGCIRLLQNPQRIAPTAMNIGIRHARGRYIIRMDAHSQYPSDYIQSCIDELERTGAGNVGGRWITLPGGDSAVARSIAAFTQMRIGVGNAEYRLGKGDRYVDTVPFGAFRREIFDQVGLYREDLVRHQDYELNARIRKAGYPIYLSSKISNVYYNVGSFGKFMRQAWMNGLWNPRAWVRYPASFCWRHAAPLAFAGGLIASILFGAWFHPLLWAGLVGFAGYMAIAIGAATVVGVRHGLDVGLWILLLMPSYHFVYGFATIIGMSRAVSSVEHTPPPRKQAPPRNERELKSA